MLLPGAVTAIAWALPLWSSVSVLVFVNLILVQLNLRHHWLLVLITSVVFLLKAASRWYHRLLVTVSFFTFLLLQIWHLRLSPKIINVHYLILFFFFFYFNLDWFLRFWVKQSLYFPAPFLVKQRYLLSLVLGVKKVYYESKYQYLASLLTLYLKLRGLGTHSVAL